MTYLPIEYMYKKRTRICENCGKQISIYPSDIARGKGMFCCKSCAAKCQSIKKDERMCKFCGTPFKTTSNDICCSLECFEELERLETNTL